MIIRKLISLIWVVVTGVDRFWIRNDDSVSVVVKMPETNEFACDGKNSEKMAEKAKRIAEKKAGRVGHIISSGVFMEGTGSNSVSAVAMADIQWKPGIEKRLYGMGIRQCV